MSGLLYALLDDRGTNMVTGAVIDTTRAVLEVYGEMVRSIESTCTSSYTQCVCPAHCVALLPYVTHHSVPTL